MKKGNFCPKTHKENEMKEKVQLDEAALEIVCDSMNNAVHCHRRVMLDTETGDVWCEFHADENSYNPYQSQAIVGVFAQRPASEGQNPMTYLDFNDNIEAALDDMGVEWEYK
jgi:hypothetical protein